MKKKIIFATILTTGRTGSDYLQSCLDSVPGVITLTGKTYFKSFFLSSDFEKNKINKKKIIRKFVKNYKNLFQEDLIENKKNNININIFIKNFLYRTKNISLDKVNFIENVFLSFEETTRGKMHNVKCILNHSHSVDETSFFLNLIKHSRLLVTIRHPLENLNSGILNWRRYSKNKLGQSHNYFYIKRILKDLRFARNIKNKKIYVKLEDANKIHIKKKISNFLRIKYSKKINIATYNGAVWVGDKLSQIKSLDGSFNKKIFQHKYKNFFSKKDIYLLKYFYREYFSFGYDVFNNLNFFDKLKYFFLCFAPLTFEFYEIKRKCFDFKSYFFYFKRVLLFLRNI